MTSYPDTNSLYQEVFDNSLGYQTEWGSHEAFVVEVIKKCTFNNVPVTGLIRVYQPCERELNEWNESKDTDDMGLADSIEMDAAGARALAASLIRAAEKAEAL